LNFTWKNESKFSNNSSASNSSLQGDKFIFLKTDDFPPEELLFVLNLYGTGEQFSESVVFNLIFLTLDPLLLEES
jgi:hypothetical protein